MRAIAAADAARSRAPATPEARTETRSPPATRSSGRCEARSGVVIVGSASPSSPPRRALGLRGYGAANLAGAAPMDPERSIDRIGSISKTVTAVAALRPADRRVSCRKAEGATPRRLLPPPSVIRRPGAGESLREVRVSGGRRRGTKLARWTLRAHSGPPVPTDVPRIHRAAGGDRACPSHVHRARRGRVSTGRDLNRRQAVASSGRWSVNVDPRPTVLSRWSRQPSWVTNRRTM